MPGGQAVTPSIDGEYRFLSVFWFACGVMLYWLIPQVQRQTTAFRFLAGVIFFGGV